MTVLDHKSQADQIIYNQRGRVILKDVFFPGLDYMCFFSRDKICGPEQSQLHCSPPLKMFAI